MLKIHKASAGSGKTFTLTRSYIKLLLGEKRQDGTYRLAGSVNRHRAILAITFTNKATEEMKARIVSQLALLADPAGKSPYRDGLCMEFHCTSGELSVQARKALNALLADFGNFNISTIDAFFQMVLRTFAREANLSGNYEVELDEMQAVYMGVNAMLSALNAADDGDGEDAHRRRQLMLWLRQYMLQKLDEGNSFNIFVRNSKITADLVDYIKKALNETYKLNADAIMGYLEDPERIMRFSTALGKAYERRRRHLVQAADATVRLLDSNGVLEGLHKNVRNPFLKWQADDIDVRKDLSNTVRTAADDPLKYFTKAYKNTPSDLVGAVGQLAADAVAAWDDMRMLAMLRANIFHMGIIGEVERRTAEVQRENNAILLGDTGTILQTIINQEEAPFIYERLGVSLRHFLIDEFQDTSRLQWLNLSPLVKESLATGNDNLIIGDEKQAIYRFRNSDPSLIIKDVPEEFAGQCEMHGHVIEENTNWRSAREIVQFNNTVFISLARQLGLGDIYANVVQKVQHADRDGYVEFAPYSDGAVSLDRMVGHILRQLGDGYRQSDIAVLCARRSECAEVVARLLRAKVESDGDGPLADLQIITDEALVVGNAPSVRQIVGVLRYVDAHVVLSHRNGNDITAAEIINRFEFFRAMGYEAAEAMGMAFSDKGSEADHAALAAAEMECVNVPSIVERIVARCISPEVCRNENLYITAFQDMVIDFCSHGNADLHSFMKWWDEKGCTRSLAVPEGVDGIRVMTIHKSKGLEFACVHVPLLSGSLSSPDNMMWVSTRGSSSGELLSIFRGPDFDAADVPPLIPLKANTVGKIAQFSQQYAEAVYDESIDRLNQVYVAFTRASRELVVGYRDKMSEISERLEAAFAEMTPDMCASVAAQRSLPSGTLVSLSDKVEHVVVESEGDDGEAVAEYDMLKIGGSTCCSESEDSSDDVVEMPPYYSYDNEDIWAMSRIEDMADMERPRQRGIVLHAVMGYVRHISDVDRAVLRASMRGILPHAEMAETACLLSKALSDPRVHRWFEGYRRLLRERTVAIRYEERDRESGKKTGETVVRHYRPDRVVWTADGAIEVVDYKFGDEESGRYIRQVRGYMNLLRRAYKGVPVRGYLWYPLSGTIIPCS